MRPDRLGATLGVTGWVLCGVLLAHGAAATAAEQRFPRDSGAIDVRDYGATGNGRDDDTAALRAAIAAAGDDTGATFWKTRIVWLPNGTYRVSAPLLKRYANGRFGSGTVLLGQSRTGTIIRLADHAPGFGSPTAPLGVIMTTAKLLDGTPTSGGKDYNGKGEGNDAYENFVENLTVDVGAGNPGAVGIDFLANNIGAVRDVTVTAGRDSGAIGIGMRRKWPGPALLQRVTVRGFDTGIAVANSEYGMTLDQVELLDQRRVGLENDGNAISAARVTIDGPGTPIVNRAPGGLIVMADTSPREAEGGGARSRPEAISGVWSGPARQPLPSDAGVLADPPADFDEPPERWVNVLAFRPPGGDPRDITAALRAALASGAATLYLPFGDYHITDSIAIPATLRRLVGMNATISVLPNRQPAFMRDTGMLRIDAAGAPLSIERIAFDMSNLGDQVAVEVAAQRDVTLRDVVTAGTSLARRPAGGRLFIEDTCCGALTIAGPAPVVARQLDTEGGGTRIAVHGTPLTILGLKTEGDCTVLQADGGAQATVLGGLFYIVGDADPGVPAFVVGDARLTASFVEESLRAGSHYTVYVRDARGGPGIEAARFPARGYGRIVPWLQRDWPARTAGRP